MHVKMKVPLSVYVLYHKSYEEGAQIYSEIYKLLCRDSQRPSFDGLDIPVYYCTGNDDVAINEIDTNRTKKIFVLLLVDSHMWRSCAWKDYVTNLIKRQKQEEIEMQICPVKLSKYAFDFHQDLRNVQFVQLPLDSLLLDNWEEFQTILFDSLIRFVKGQGVDKVNIFISHSKKDSDCLGVERAKELRDYLHGDTKLDSFFDVNDIMAGFRFDKQIEEKVKHSILLILFTNTYSSREWCRREVLAAKRNRIPTIAVFMVNGMVGRVFPYIGNIPSTVYEGDWRPVVNLLLRTALDQYHEELLLEGIKQDDTEILPFHPEAYSFSILDKRMVKILYPEPPLGMEELDVLRDINSDVEFYTPMQYRTLEMDLKNSPVAISVSEGNDLDQFGIGEEMFSDLLVELCRHILIAKGKIVYGGDLRANGYTELFKELSFQYGQYEKSGNDTIYFTDYVSWPLSLNIKLEDENDYCHSRVKLIKVGPANTCVGINTNDFLPPNTVENLYHWGCSLTKMREEMESAVKARILVGGRKNGFKGSMAGVLEEFIMAKRMGHPIYLVGGLGGITRMLVELIEGERTVQSFIDAANEDALYGQLMGYYKSQGQPIDYSVLEGLSIADLNTGLCEEKVRTLFHSTNIMEIVSIVLEGLKSIAK